MTENKPNEKSASPAVHVAPSPHLWDNAVTTRSMMLDVLIALVPVLAVAIWVFQWHAIVLVGLCVLS